MYGLLKNHYKNEDAILLYYLPRIVLELPVMNLNDFIEQAISSSKEEVQHFFTTLISGKKIASIS